MGMESDRVSRQRMLAERVLMAKRAACSPKFIPERVLVFKNLDYGELDVLVAMGQDLHGICVDYF